MNLKKNRSYEHRIGEISPILCYEFDYTLLVGDTDTIDYL